MTPRKKEPSPRRKPDSKHLKTGKVVFDERKDTNMNFPRSVTRDEWLKARKALLAKEKDFDHERDSLTEARRKLPMVKVEKEYVFDGPQGAVTLRDLFERRRQLIVYHLMFDPAGTTACKHCSCVMDNIAGGLIHLTARDTSFAAISRAPNCQDRSVQESNAVDLPLGFVFYE